MLSYLPSFSSQWSAGRSSHVRWPPVPTAPSVDPQALTMCDWSFIMYNAQDAVSSWVFPIFWLMVIGPGSIVSA